MDGLMDGWMDGWMDWLMDGLMNGWMNWLIDKLMADTVPQYLSEHEQTFLFQDDLGVGLMSVQQFHLLQGTVKRRT